MLERSGGLAMHKSLGRRPKGVAGALGLVRDRPDFITSGPGGRLYDSFYGMNAEGRGPFDTKCRFDTYVTLRHRPVRGLSIGKDLVQT